VRQLHVRQSGASGGAAENTLEGLQLLQPQRAAATGESDKEKLLANPSLMRHFPPTDHNQGVHKLPEDRHRVQDPWNPVGHYKQGGYWPAAKTVSELLRFAVAGQQFNSI